jgi:hypothetical protein
MCHAHPTLLIRRYAKDSHSHVARHRQLLQHSTYMKILQEVKFCVKFTMFGSGNEGPSSLAHSVYHNGRLSRWARGGAHQQWPHTVPDVAHAAPNVVHTASRFPMHPMCNTRSTFQTSRCNSYNIQKKQKKHLKQASETLAKTPKNI